MRLAAPPPSRRPSLTPMIDVVFLLLVFFMLASRFGTTAAIPVAAATGAADLSGPPRLVTIAPDAVRLNGVELPEAELAPRLLAILPGPEAAVVLRAEAGVSLQRLVAVMEALRAAGLPALALAEGP